MSDQPDIQGPTRRHAVAGLGAAAAIGLLGQAADAQPAAAGEVTGIVYESRAGAPRQASDPGVPDVLVSNGREVVRTDRQGRYRLPMGPEGLVFVIKPSGWQVPLDENNLPLFSYLHQPGGTPADLGLRFAGVAPTGRLPDSVDFGLVRTPEPTAFDVILFTDPQPETATELDYVRDTAVARAFGIPAAFGMTTGDIMFDDLSLYGRYNRMIGRVGIPWWHIGGNHDLNFEAPDAERSRETFKRVYGAPYYAFTHGEALFLMLDNVRYLGAGSARTPGASGRYEGRIGERQLAFVANVLRETPRDRLVVVAMHIPLVTDISQDPAENTVDRDELLKLLDGRRVLSVSGHTHTTEHHDMGDSHHHLVMTAVSGSWWGGPLDRNGIATADSRDGTPNGFHVLSVKGGGDYTVRFVPAQEDASRQMRISLESQFHGGEAEVSRQYSVHQVLGSPISAEGAGATRVVVNVFDGGPATSVHCRIGRREPVELKRTRRPDPFVAQVYARNNGTRKPWVKAEPSTHIWSGNLPADLEPGTYRLEVEASDRGGRKLSDAIVLEVTGSGPSPMPRRT